MSPQRLTNAKRVVIKIGSALLVDEAQGTVHRKWLETLAADVARLKARGQEVILVSSGAIAVGRKYLNLPDGVLKLEDKQAAAATGQIRLAHAYQEVLGFHDVTVAQILVTLDDTENRRRYLNVRNTLNAILRRGGVPLINENDSVATDEIRYGDNDRLAACIAAMSSTDLLVLLSDIDGLYTADPGKDAAAEHLPEITAITPEIEAMAGGSGTPHGSGGMVTKLAAAKICLSNGCAMVITKGQDEHPLQVLENGAKASWFKPSLSPVNARNQWISGALRVAGTYVLDAAAVQALKDGKSLLPIGVTGLEGTFEKGDAVALVDASNTELARGLSSYSSTDAQKIIGKESSQIEAQLGYRGRDALVHSGDLAMAKKV